MIRLNETTNRGNVMKSIEIKLIKLGIIFFRSPATLNYGFELIEVVDSKGAVKLSASPATLKEASLNSINGMLTLRNKTKQNCNISFNDKESLQKFLEYLDENKVNGYSL